MNLTYRITLRISIVLSVLFTTWAIFFYVVIINEINDETDDSLEDYSEYIITRFLGGETLPSSDNGTNNSYHIAPADYEYVRKNKKVAYFDEMVYIESKKETEPARVLKTLFRDAGDNFYELVVSIPTIEKEDLRHAILWWTVSLYLLLLLAIIVINIWVLHRSFRPLYVLLGWLKRFTVGKDMEPLENDTEITEFRRLNEAVLSNARRNTELYEEQKRFIENASHELQTPLAVCRNRLEMLSENPDLNEQQLGEVLKTRQTVDHAIRLNQTLLLLSKIENGQVGDPEPVDVNRLVKGLVEDYNEVYGYCNISMELDERDTLMIGMDRGLASVLFGNLLKNAYVHNREGGSIFVRIAHSGMEISNTGVEEALHPADIFKRFYQGMKRGGGMGLGLAMADSVCKLYGITLSYRYSGQGKHSFLLLLPGYNSFRKK